MQNGYSSDVASNANVRKHQQDVNYELYDDLTDELSLDYPDPPPSRKTAPKPYPQIVQDAAGPQTPRGKKRKLGDLAALQRSRAISPPWKKVEADGPPSFVENGRRKSSRTNAIPLELQPQGERRKTRADLHKAHESKRRVSLPTASPQNHVKSEMTPKRGNSHSTSKVGRPPSSSRAPPLNDQKKHTPRSLTKLPSTRSPKISKTTPPDHSPTIARSRRTREPHLPPSSDPKQAKSPPKPHQHPSTTSTFVKSLRLNYRPPPIPILNSRNVIPTRKFASLREFLIHDDALEGEREHRLSAEEARREALSLNRLEDEGRAGGILDSGSWATSSLETHGEPAVPYTHPDYVLKHLEDFKLRLERERREHQAKAKLLAESAKKVWDAKQPRSREQILKDHYEKAQASKRKCLKELKEVWRKVEEIIRAQKRQKLESEEQDRRNRDLKAMLDRSSNLLVERRRRRTSAEFDGEDVHDNDINATTDFSEDATGTSQDSDADDESGNPSDTETESEVLLDSEAAADDKLTAEELRLKYSNLPELEDLDPKREENEGSEPDETGEAAGNIENAEDSLDEVNDREEPPSLEEVDEVMLDDSDEETDSDDGTSESEDEDDDDDDADEDTEGEDEDPSSSLLGFFSKGTRKALVGGPNPLDMSMGTEGDTVPQSREGIDVNQEIRPDLGTAKISLDGSLPLNVEAASTSDDPSCRISPGGTSESKKSEQESASSFDAAGNETEPETTLTKPSDDLKTKIPMLLRGQLREYQHYGLDWLAGMYANQTNGILADEMGLGKTIQTIALLAHLATHEHVWGPHLIVVPTSVMLNWEMEFKKWCPGFKILTYYGTQEERKLKRKGWMDNDRWHVCITSYQLALQDASSLKRRRWHYLILDEAHNIKNFRSQRWQTLLMFKTKARLLLTGTPLQNNLTELWSLLFFLAPEQDEQGDYKFADLSTFANMFRHPVSQILDHGREAMDDKGREIVAKLHRVLRPHLLRRLKADVEKQMPKKYEHIVKCRLSKRQRQLYDGYMGLAGTRESFASGNYMSIINCLMQLRKVCNHPDLFETRQIVTSYAMPKSAIASYEIKELLVRRRLIAEEGAHGLKVDVLNLWNQNSSSNTINRRSKLAALGPLGATIQQQNQILNSTPVAHCNTIDSALDLLALHRKQSMSAELGSRYRATTSLVQRRPVYSQSLLDRVDSQLGIFPLRARPQKPKRIVDWHFSNTSILQEMVHDLYQVSEDMKANVTKFAFATPAVVSSEITKFTLTDAGIDAINTVQQNVINDPFHEARVRLSIAFPDKTLIQYDCGKLQQLDRLLRQLQAGGHRALIFTQMTKVLDILEQFLNLHGHRYLRLDGATKIEQRQVLTDRFNNDTRILAFILSSRSGGLGINLTGADTVIFYDLDWNPAMDKQCQDRCHRIGQTRDVHIYRFVSEGTIEANILRKSNQKRMLDDVVIQEGDFTTDYFNRIDYKDLLDEVNRETDDEADAALDKILGSNGEASQNERAFEQVEDQEDRDAARRAQKEYVHTDDADFSEEKSAVLGAMPGSGSAGTPHPTTDSNAPPTPMETGLAPSSTAVTPGPDTPAAGNPDGIEDEGADEEDAEAMDTWEQYMLRFKEWDLRDVKLFSADEIARRKAKKALKGGSRGRGRGRAGRRAPADLRIRR